MTYVSLMCARAPRRNGRGGGIDLLPSRSKHVCVCVYVCVCVHAFMCVSLFARACWHVHVCARDMRTYVKRHIHSHAHPCVQVSEMESYLKELESAKTSITGAKVVREGVCEW